MWGKVIRNKKKSEIIIIVTTTKIQASSLDACSENGCMSMFQGWTFEPANVKMSPRGHSCMPSWRTRDLNQS